MFRNSCFKKSQRTLTWNSAQEACGNLNSNLTSIHSAEEAQFIYKNLVPGSSKVWIGFNDITTEDVFVWADGSDVKYTDWRTSSGEPNDFGKGEDCTIIIVRDLKWVDFPCDKKLPFICRFTPVYLTVC